jgi:acyl-CoA synthetase (NDP forming)
MICQSVLEFFDTSRAFESSRFLEETRSACSLTWAGWDDLHRDPAMRVLHWCSPETHSALRSACAPMANIGHPDGYVDLTAAHYEKLHNQVLGILFQEENVDLVLQTLAPSAFIDQKLIVEEIARAYECQKGNKKTFLNAITFGHFARDVREGLESAGLPTFEYPDMLARVAGNMANYAAYRKTAAAGMGN